MGNLKAKILLATFLFILIGLFYYYPGNYRFTPIAAAKAHFDVGKDASSFGEVDFGWSKVYLINTNKGPRTVISIKSGFLWRAPAATYSKTSTDAVRTVGFINYRDKHGQAIVLAVETSDPSVAYIEVGTDNERIRKDIKKDITVIFSWNSWNKILQPIDFKPIAFSIDGTPLYEYKNNPKTPNVFRSDEEKWYPVKIG